MKIVNMNERKIAFVEEARTVLGGERTTITRPEAMVIKEALGLAGVPSWLKKLKTENRGEYYLPTTDGKIETIEDFRAANPTIQETMAVAMAPQALSVLEEQESYLPESFDGYVSWGNFNTVKSVVKSKMFYPIFITGMSGNGKTLMVKEVCAKLKREFVRTNITIETDEDDLIGGFRLQNGETVWHDGPVVMAMKRGAVLLLDEIDLASNKVMCLQPILEGSSVYIKKIGKWVHPAPGFTVIATANTKGQGSDDGRFIGTNVLNEAFLERFPITLEQSYPTNKVESKILTNELAKIDKVDNEFVGNLIKWADVIRKTFMDGGVDEIISTRRLVHIVGAYGIFDNKLKSIEMCVSRFDTETKDSFLDLYTKVDSGVSVDDIMAEQNQEDEADANVDQDDDDDSYSFS
ncbi:MAG: MoxR family ATPase [Candidatus Pacebacteria bacterium]|nr:MoxR family ATPase [Candidatus Paceibacterota bacterium]